MDSDDSPFGAVALGRQLGNVAMGVVDPSGLGRHTSDYLVALRFDVRELPLTERPCQDTDSFYT